MSSPFKTAAVHTLGCKVNFTETSMIAKQFQEDGILLHLLMNLQIFMWLILAL